MEIVGNNRAKTERRKTQNRHQIFEFALLAILLEPMFLGALIVEMNLDDMYIHGGNFCTHPLRQEGLRLAQGLNFRTGSSARLLTRYVF
jgi:hypothetical protein